MATPSANPFDLLHGDDASCENFSVLVAKVSTTKITHPSSQVKEKTKIAAPAQLPSKPVSPAEYVRTGGRGTGRGTGGRGTGRGTGGRGTGRGGHGDNNQTDSTTNGGNSDWQVVRYGHGDGKGNGDWKNKDGRGSGRGNGNRGYSKNENVKTSDVPVEKEEDKEMSLAEFEKVRLEKKKALNAVKGEERKVVALESEFKNMKVLGKKNEEELSSSVKLQKSGKGNKLKKKESLAEEKARKSMLLHNLLKSDNNGKSSDNGAQGDCNGPSREEPEQPKKEIKRATQVPSTWLSALKGESA